MASDPPIPIFQNNNEDEDLLDDDTDNDDSSSSAAALHVTTPIPPPAPITAVKKPTAQIDESRKLFQRLWTDEDEIELLQGYLDYTTQRNGPHSSQQHHHDTSAFYDQIRSKFQLDFNKNQLVEKLRRLKKKYRNVVNKFGSGKEYVFKSPHDQATFDISSRIWGNIIGNGSGFRPVAPAVLEDVEDVDPESPNFNDIDMNNKFPRPRKRSKVGVVKMEKEKQQQVEAVTPVGVTLAGSITGVIEETAKSCLSPIFKELLGNSVNSNGVVNGAGLGSVSSTTQLGFGGIGAEKMGDGRWRKQQILELEVFSKRLELMQDEINEKLQELRSMGD